MKRIHYATLLFLLVTLYITPRMLAQPTDKKDYTGAELDDFTKLVVGDAFYIELIASETNRYELLNDKNQSEHIVFEMNEDELTIRNKPITPKSKLFVRLYYTDLHVIDASGASSVEAKVPIKADYLKLMAGGGADIILALDVENLNTKATSAADMILTGKVSSHEIQTTGAATVIADELNTKTSKVKAEGSSSVVLFAEKELDLNIRGAATVTYNQNPAPEILNEQRTISDNDPLVVVYEGGSRTYRSRSYSDTTRVNVGSVNIEVIEGDSTKVTVGNREIVVDEEGNVKVNQKRKKRKFDGHWGGFELGFSGFVTPEFSMNFPKEYDYLRLRMEKSVNVNLNLFEQNFGLNKAKTLGVVTGIGTNWVNYRFQNNVFLTPDSSEIQGYYINGASMRKSKLTAWYLTFPVLFEYQNQADRKKNRFHISAGVIMSMRLSTHTKLYYNEANKPYSLNDPVTGEVVALATSPGNSSRNIVKDFNSFHLRPFKFEGSLRIGYGYVNLFFTYGLNTLFLKDRGPELYPWTAGITIVGW